MNFNLIIHNYKHKLEYNIQLSYFINLTKLLNVKEILIYFTVLKKDDK
jgi:hypothetical protein